MTTKPTYEELVRELCGHGNCEVKGAYRLKVGCYNCGWTGHIELTKGHEFSQYSAECPKCECNRLHKI